MVENQGQIGAEHKFSKEKLTTLMALYHFDTFEDALETVHEIYETGGKGHSCGIYSHDDGNIDALARLAPVSRMMVRQPQSKANAGSWTNGMPMTSSLGCGVWGGNITNENVTMKHMMNYTWVSRPIAEDRPSEQELFGEFFWTGGCVMDGSAVIEKTVAEHIVSFLERRNVEHVFGLCGHTNIAVLAALADSPIDFITVRHEQIASHAADAYARVTGKASVVLSHLSPGLTNCATGVANAALDCIPMVVIAGDIPTHYYGKHPHQEVNLHADAAQWEIYRPFVKRAWRVDRADLMAEILEKAFHLAESGQPGPVLVNVPMDIFSAVIPSDSFDRVAQNTRALKKPSLDDETAREIVRALAGAKAPVAYVGGGILLAQASEELRQFVEHMELPLAHSLMGKGALSDAHPLVMGMTGFWGTKLVNQTCLEADYVFALGTRFKEADCSSWYPDLPLISVPMGMRLRSFISTSSRRKSGVITPLKSALSPMQRPRSRF